ncbi:hypothetical protein VC33_04875 [Pseudomonas fluorescens]|nr:hypothetical protein VC33_04875 [Pseudomonas fluorescens]
MFQHFAGNVGGDFFHGCRIDHAGTGNIQVGRVVDGLEYCVLIVGRDQQTDHFFLRIDGDAEQAVPLTGAKPVGVVDNGAWAARITRSARPTGTMQVISATSVR